MVLIILLNDLGINGDVIFIFLGLMDVVFGSMIIFIVIDSVGVI